MAAEKPKIPEKEVKKIEEQFEHVDKNLEEIADLPVAQAATVDPTEHSLSQKELNKNEIYLKPERSLGSSQKFNEKFREKWNFEKEYVKFIADNKEVIGEAIETWTRPRGGVPAEFWRVPVNKPVWGPRYLAEQIRRKTYHRLKMQEKTVVSSDGMGTYHGAMVVDEIVPRLTAEPVSQQRSVFMGRQDF